MIQCKICMLIVHCQSEKQGCKANNIVSISPTDMCHQVECRGCVGETVFHVCFLMGTPIHMHLAKRLLKY